MKHGIYVRQGSDVQGPFPREQIVQWMHEGKILTNMMLSADGRNWRPADDAAELLVPQTATPTRPHRPSRGAEPRGPRNRRSDGRRRPSRPARRSTPTWVPFVIGGTVVVLAIVVVVAVTGNSGGSSDSSANLKPGEIVAQAEDSVALVRSPALSGTGFMVADGVLATSARVMRRMLLSDLEVYFPSANRQRYSVDRVLDLDDRDDICLLAVRANMRPLALSVTGIPPTGEELVFIGNPGGGPDPIAKPSASRAIISSTERRGGRAFLMIRAALPTCLSGGPALDDRGAVVGMLTQMAPKPDTTVFVLPARAIRDALARAKRRTPDEIRKLNQRHLAGAVYLRIEAAAEQYVGLMDRYYEGANSAFERGIRDLDQLQKHMPDLSEDVARVRASVGEDLGRYFDMVEEMAWLGRTAREELRDFQWMAQTFEGHAMSRDLIALIDFLGKYENLQPKYEALQTSLRKRFDLPKKQAK